MKREKGKIYILNRGFTLVELLVVMAILGILVTLIAGGFRTAQFRGRDARRKADLKQLANSLETFLSDYGAYPEDQSGKIAACPYTISGGTACSWGESEFTDGKTTYFRVMPEDPVSSQYYVYRIVPGSNNKKFQIFARLENTKDQDCMGGDCNNPPVSYQCGGGLCNFATTSSNTTVTE